MDGWGAADSLAADRGSPDSWSEAPRKAVRHDGVVAVEHPCVIKNVENGVDSLGGEAKIASFLDRESGENATLGLSLRPYDVLAKQISSQAANTNNVLLKITVPGRTGRKRKRGSDQPFELHDKPTSKENRLPGPRELQRCLRDNLDKYTVEPVSIVKETHRFRTLPDFQYTTSTNPLMNQLRGMLTSENYQDLFKFKFDPDDEHVHGTPDVGPPPSFSTQIITPVNYLYKQNPNLRWKEDRVSSRLVPVNIQKPISFGVIEIPPDFPSVPTKSSSTLPPEASLDPSLQDGLRELRAAFEERPIMSRRAMLNIIAPRTACSEYYLRMMCPYVGYSFSAGPWKDVIVRFGLDPRKDEACRVYQTLTFKLQTPNERAMKGRIPGNVSTGRRRPTAMTRNYRSHIFDGTCVGTDGKTWQVCDITDPLIRSILDHSSTRKEFDLYDGWYPNVTWAKAKIITRDKMTMLLAGEMPVNEEYQRIVDFPETVDESNSYLLAPGRDSEPSAKETYLCGEIRGAIRPAGLSWAGSMRVEGLGMWRESFTKDAALNDARENGHQNGAR
ncbi:RNA polymerase III transcription factor IIIC subunit-domain-containing protein [Lineolata rhizophorae]|uniref:RNA polymerase III transcription factor IIIC subunit-domain-containing protein n=1 Tax=Lineolata rhizophorae TaxID=578093 RepID=A0A6A6NVP0_9PEZI|nr:RNA polymerase III transcription factor IIIC subunit-domain-containing protein [Lineolata rhizophorae]